MKRAFSVPAFAFGLTLAVAAVGCRQIVGFADEPGPASHGAGSADGGLISRSGGWTFADPVCGACVELNCSAEEKACTQDPSCQTYETCVAACASGDAVCASQCETRVPSVIESPEITPLSHCVASSCNAACRASVVGADGQTCGPVFGRSQCTECCCDEFAACDANPACVRQLLCGRRCGTPDPIDPPSVPCFDECLAETTPLAEADDAAVPVDADSNIGTCVGVRCANTCFEEDWSCLGHVESPGSSAGPLTVYGYIEDYRGIDPTGVTPLPNFTVKACSYLTCATPIAESVSNDDANVQLALTPGLDAYFEVTAPAGLDYPTHLFFLPQWLQLHSFRWTFDVYRRDSLAVLPPSEPGRGAVLFLVHDCNPRLSPSPPRAAGVEVTAEPPGDPAHYTLKNFVPDDGAIATDENGVGFIINLQPGVVKLFAHRHDTGELIGITPIIIRADATTVVELVPTPTL